MIDAKLAAHRLRPRLRTPQVVGIDGDGIVVGGCGQTGSGRPAFVPGLPKHCADPDVDVVVQDEAH
jgi:hypothetical protein